MWGVGVGLFAYIHQYGSNRCYDQINMIFELQFNLVYRKLM